MPWFDGSTGAVHHEAWLPPGEVHSVIVFLHGFGEHLGLYEPMAHTLNAHDHAVYALDAMGHGQSGGSRGLITFDEYVADARSLVTIARDRHPAARLVVAGHSAGALTAYLLTLREPQICHALVLSGGPLLPLDWVADLLAGGADPDGESPLDPTAALSTHPDYVHALLHDPLIFDGPFPQPMLESMARSWAEAEHGLSRGRPDMPTLVIHGELDPVVPVHVAEEVARRLPAATLRVFPGDLHDVLNEHDRDSVHDCVAQFVRPAGSPMHDTSRR